MNYFRKNITSTSLLTISLMMVVVGISFLFYYTSIGKFYPPFAKVISQARGKNDPILCTLTSSPLSCLKELMHPYAVDGKIPEPLVIDCDRLEDTDLKALCGLTIGKLSERTLCDQIKNNFAKEECITELASRRKDVKICDDFVIKTDPEGKILTREDQLRRDCLTRIAYEGHTTKPCDLIEEGYRSFCLNDVKYGHVQ